MKINRHNSNEKNKVTSFWLYEFAYDLEKNAENLDFLKDYLNQRNNKKFFTIEEKLADIKERVGFDLARKITNEMEKTSSVISNCGCNSVDKDICHCQVKVASKKSQKDIDIMSNILKYIKDMIKHEPHLNSAVIISRCKNEDGLKYNVIESKIDNKKLTDYINNLLGEQSSDELTSYIPIEERDSAEADNSIAEYYRHAEPGIS